MPGEVMTMIEYAKDSDPLTKGVVELYQQTSDVLARMGFETWPGGAYKYHLEGAPHGIAFRGINESYTPTTGVINPQVETLYTAGGEADVDTAIVRQHGEGRRTRETSSKVKQFARVLTSKIFTGNNSTEPREFDGLQTRITGSQLVVNNAGSGGGALSLAKLDELILRTRGCNALIMSPLLKLRFTALMRDQTLLGNVQMGKDDLGRPVPSYNGLPILCGWDGIGPDDSILPFTETGAGGGSAVCSSIYAVRFSGADGDGLRMGQSAPMSVKNLGELQSEPKWRTRVEHDVGMVIEDPYAVARLSSITNAAIAA